jgi:hypothetical protein
MDEGHMDESHRDEILKVSRCIGFFLHLDQ